MFDCHCHILPGIDDGSKNVLMSLDMLDMEVRQGVEGIIFTPHFYADMMSPEHFLEKRAGALAELEANLYRLPMYPQYIAGSEVHYFRGMSRVDGIESLCIGNSDYILIEMPFRDWQANFIDEIEEMSTVLGLKVIIAHIERYFDKDKRLINRLLDNPNFLIQCNAEFFIDKSTQGKALRFLKSGRIDLLGTDCHRNDKRMPNLADAVEIISRKDKKGSLNHINSVSRKIFDAAI